MDVEAHGLVLELGHFGGIGRQRAQHRGVVGLKGHALGSYVLVRRQGQRAGREGTIVLRLDQELHELGRSFRVLGVGKGDDG